MRRHYHEFIDIILEHNINIAAEVGVYKGRFTKKVLSSGARKLIKEYWAVDQWKVLPMEHGRMAKISQKDWDDMYLACCKMMMYFGRLKVVRASSLEASMLFNNGRFDIVYIDASHFYVDVKRDIVSWLPKISNKGFISGHDFGTGDRKQHNVKKAVLEVFPSEKVQLFNDGVWLARKQDARYCH